MVTLGRIPEKFNLTNNLEPGIMLPSNADIPCICVGTCPNEKQQDVKINILRQQLTTQVLRNK